jgi:hypothetical protein
MVAVRNGRLRKAAALALRPFQEQTPSPFLPQPHAHVNGELQRPDVPVNAQGALIHVCVFQAQFLREDVHGHAHGHASEHAYAGPGRVYGDGHGGNSL